MPRRDRGQRQEWQWFYCFACEVETKKKVSESLQSASCKCSRCKAEIRAGWREFNCGGTGAGGGDREQVAAHTRASGAGGCHETWSEWVCEEDPERDQSECPKCGGMVVTSPERQIEGRLPREDRQFLCSGGGKSHARERTWWVSDVVVGDPWSKCNSCGVFVEALDRDDEFGIAQFLCECGNEFYGRVCARDTSQCFKCNRMVEGQIRSQYQSKLQGRPRSKNRHSCSSCANKKDCPIFKMMEAYCD